MSVGILRRNDTKNKKLYLAFYVSNAEKIIKFYIGFSFIPLVL